MLFKTLVSLADSASWEMKGTGPEVWPLIVMTVSSAWLPLAKFAVSPQMAVIRLATIFLHTVGSLLAVVFDGRKNLTGTIPKPQVNCLMKSVRRHTFAGAA